MAVNRHKEAVAPVRTRGHVSSWFARHIDTASASLRRLARQPFASLMIIGVIAITLAIPSVLHLMVKNALAVSGGWDDALDFSVFLADELSLDDAGALKDLIAQRADVATVTLVSREAALEEFREQSGFGAALDQLAANPLPHTLIVRPAAFNTPESIGLLREELGNLPETAAVQVDTDWVQRFHAILAIVDQSIGIGAALLGLAILVIIGNTIRLDVENRRDEIEVTKLIGASDGFVRRPFLWSGLWYGFLGGLLAVLLVEWGLYLLDEPVTRLAGLYRGNVELLRLSLEEIGLVVGGGAALGLVGSWFAASRRMRAIEPGNSPG
ncbi:MAG: permease-like cell division protein FtsX [Pseudomonadota bacterium]